MRKHIYSIAYCLLYISFSHTMDQSIFSKISSTQAALAQLKKKVPIWDNNLVPSDAQLPSFIPKSLIITPNEEGVVMSFPGLVKYLNLNDRVLDQATERKDKLAKKKDEDIKKVSVELSTLIRHAHKKYCPIIAVAEQENKLIVVSVLNPEKEEKKAQCIIVYNEIDSAESRSGDIFRNRYYEEKEINGSVQAVTLSADGNILAIAFTDSIQIFDLQESSCCKKFFIPRVQGNDTIVDLSEAVSVVPFSDDRRIALVNTKGMIDLKTISKNGQFCFENLKGVNTGDNIRKIHLFNEQDILYVTTAGEVKIIDLNNWLEHFQGKVKNRIISRHEGGKAAVDQGLNYGTIHWIDNPDRSENDRSTIYVHRENNTTVEDFDISIQKDIAKMYNCLTTTGQKILRPMHVLHAALRRNTVIALLTDGNLCCWSLSQKYQAPTELMVTNPDLHRIKGRLPVGKKELSHSPSSPQIPHKTRNRSSTEGGEQNAEYSTQRGSVKIPYAKISEGGSKEKFKNSSSSHAKQGVAKKKNSKENNQEAKREMYMEVLSEDIFNDIQRKKQG